MAKKTFQDKVAEAKKIYGDKYDYSKASIFDEKYYVTIICPQHGEFKCRWERHLRHHQECPHCSGAHVGKLTTEEFVRRAKLVWGDRYDYSKVNVESAKNKVEIICHEKDDNGQEHGSFFIRVDHFLKSGIGCPKCSKKKKLTQEEWIEKAKEAHKGENLDYSKVQYKKVAEKVTIICHEKDESGEEHGEFEVTPYYFIKGGCKCPKCNTIDRQSQEEFIAKAKEKYGDKYDYSQVKYENTYTKVAIICHEKDPFGEEHGIFYQTPAQHLKSVYGCPKCAGCAQLTYDDFVKRANKIHNGKYGYSKFKYVNMYEKSTITCPIHGDFELLPTQHINGKIGCPKCTTVKNIGNTFDQFYKDVYENISSSITKMDNLIRLGDSYVLYYTLQENTPSLLRTIMANYKNHNLNLLIVFEDEYLENRDIVLNKIKHIFRIDTNLPKIMGRKCVIKEITHHEADEFLNRNHIQGTAGATVYLGAYYEDKLVAVMSFLKEKELVWNLVRFASDNNYICQGIGGKMFKYFTKNYDYSYIKSFADKRWTYDSTDNIYTKLGFILEKTLNPDYRYFKDGEKVRHHKFGFRKQILNKKYGLPLTMTEREMTESLGYKRIYDCGLYKYIYNKH